MRNDSVAAGFTSSLIFHKDGSVTARYGYDRAVRLLYEYERSGVAPDHADRYNMIFFRALADFCYKARQGYRQKTTIFAVDRGMAP